MGTEIWVAIIGALSGTAVLKVIEWWINKGRVKDDTATQFRRELREDVSTLRADLEKTNEDLDKWKEKYYGLLEQFIRLKSQLDLSLDEIHQGIVDEHILAGSPKEIRKDVKNK